jgi:hypothetical protein
MGPRESGDDKHFLLPYRVTTTVVPQPTRL